MGIVYFNDIENAISSLISSSEEKIYVAVAWFTNKVLFDELNKALQRNVNVKVLILDDILNRNEFGLDFGLLANNGADIRFSTSQKGIMHNKFCVIDDKVITGSYNWTYHANKNSENIVVIDEPNLTISYSTQFETLFCNAKPITLPYEFLNWTEVKEEVFSELYSNILREVLIENEADKDDKKAKLEKIKESYQNGTTEDVEKDYNRHVHEDYVTITDVLTNPNIDFTYKLWKRDKIGEPYNAKGFKRFCRWIYIPEELRTDKNKHEYVHGALYPWPYGSVINPLDASRMQLDIYDSGFIKTLIYYGGKKLNIEDIPDKLLCIKLAKMVFYEFPTEMFHKTDNYKANSINVLGLAKKIEGENIHFYDGWDPIKRGDRITKEFFINVR